jgi:hypothetical protein
MSATLVPVSYKAERAAIFNRFYTPATNILRVVMYRGNYSRVGLVVSFISIIRTARVRHGTGSQVRRQPARSGVRGTNLHLACG